MLEIVSEVSLVSIPKGSLNLPFVRMPTDSTENILHIITGSCLLCSALPFNMQGALLFNWEKYILSSYLKISFDSEIE